MDGVVATTAAAALAAERQQEKQLNVRSHVLWELHLGRQMVMLRDATINSMGLEPTELSAKETVAVA